MRQPPTTWDDYHVLRASLDRGDTATVLAATEAIGSELRVPFTGLRALACERLGRHDEAVAVLSGLVASGEADYWTHYMLANNLRALGDMAGCARHSRQAHALNGWPESERHGYIFTHDYFSPNLHDWRGWFAEHVTTAPIAALEIGSWQGASAAWLLDAVVGPRGGSLTCIDTFAGSSEHPSAAGWALPALEATFDANIARTGRAAMVRKLVGTSQAILPRLAGEQFDFIYIDGAHEAKFVIQDAVLCWGLLRVGGFLLFDDVPYRFTDHPAQDTHHATDFFRAVFADDITVVADGRQLLLRRSRA